MNVLIAGYGGIGQAIHSLLKIHPLDWIDEIHIAEIKQGPSAQEVIGQKKDRLDLVINVTTDDDGSIRALCGEHNLHYLDTGLEMARDIVELLTRPTGTEAVNLLCFGMNPGLIEFMYRKQNVTRPHSVVEIEHDTAECSGAPFGTWSPAMYYNEAVDEPPFAYMDGKVQEIMRSDDGADIELEIEGHLRRKYLWIPHEEVWSIGRSNKNCQFAGFLYSAPSQIQSLALECRRTGRKFPEVPVRHQVEGADTIGVMLIDEKGEAVYVYNRAAHHQCYQRYGVNATCWQVACGIYAGLSIIGSLKPGAYTMSTVPEKVFPIIEASLASLGFVMERQPLKRPQGLLESLRVKLPDGRQVPCCSL